ncbi:hypothetical protein CK203_014367 [Vitis vinifera]|uniref:Uncharacterized protein n=1 Tax=Vitis vinifera TaxID=29760 RepID=A0A438K4R0_VITVI|nr:hypothetical protein CK203_014367 [Vitis vinifera]
MSNMQSQGLPTSTQCKRKESFLLNLIKIPRVSMMWRLKRENLHSVDEEPRRTVIKEDMMKKHMPPPFSQALHGKKGTNNASENFEVLRQVKKAFLTKQVSAIIQWKSPVKYKVGTWRVEATSITLSLADRSVKIPRGMIKDVLVQVDKFYYPMDFVVLDTDPVVKGTNYVPIILGRPLLATSNAIINCRNGVMQLTFSNMTLELNIFHLYKKHIHQKKKKVQRKCA